MYIQAKRLIKYYSIKGFIFTLFFMLVNTRLFAEDVNYHIYFQQTDYLQKADYYSKEITYKDLENFINETNLPLIYSDILVTDENAKVPINLYTRFIYKELGCTLTLNDIAYKEQEQVIGDLLIGCEQCRKDKVITLSYWNLMPYTIQDKQLTPLYDGYTTRYDLLNLYNQYYFNIKKKGDDRA